MASAAVTGSPVAGASASASAAASAEPSSAPATPSAAATAGPGDLAAELVTPGHLTYCANLRPGPMSFADATGKPAGADIDIATEIARRAGLVADIRETPFEQLIDAVAGGQCDISISSQHITSSRLARIDMLPYAQGVQHVVVRKGNPSRILRLSDLCGRILAVQTGSTHVDLVLGQGDHAGAGIDTDCASAGKPNVDLRQFTDDGDAIAALAAGTADAYIGSDFAALDRPADFQLAVALPPARNGIGMPKGHPAIKAAVEGAFQAMVADGTYLTILKHWGVAGLSIAR